MDFDEIRQNFALAAAAVADAVAAYLTLPSAPTARDPDACDGGGRGLHGGMGRIDYTVV